MIAVDNLIALECKNPACGKDFLAYGNQTPKETCCDHCGSQDWDYISPFRRAVLSVFKCRKNKKA